MKHDSRITARVPVTVRKEFERLATAAHLDVSTYLRVLVMQHISRKGKKAA